MPRTRATLPKSYRAAADALGSRESRVIANNTRLVWEPRTGALSVRLHDTDVVTFFRDGLIMLSPEGHYTRTTLDRINACLPAGFYVTGSCESGWTGRRPMHWREWELITPDESELRVELND